MPRYAPLPSVPIDPRNESQLVQDASQKVYEASNGTLNDFSSGNPLAALLEGQAFAQGEFLFWANQLPDKILLEWIGPFLGAMRRLGTPAAALVKVTIPPQNIDVIIPSGSTFDTDPQLTAGQSITFISDGEYTIPAGSTEISIPVYSKFVGSDYNSPANSITSPPAIGITGITATNPQPAVGGSDVETYAQVQERFFTLIRRRNPVSQSDWQDFFTDLFGEGTLTTVQPNRSSAVSYNYNTDYNVPNGQVSFFVLGPDGVELTKDQIRRGQNIINFSVPIENQGHLYPITLSQAQYNLTLEVDANGTYGSNYQPASLDFRNRAYLVLTPGNVFPSDTNPTVSDVDAAFYNTFTSNGRFKDPRILSSSVYNTPTLLDKTAATYTNILDFQTGTYLLNQRDLVSVEGTSITFYPVEESFTPYSTSKYDQTIYGNLALKQIKELTTGLYNLGDVVTMSNQLFVVLENISIGYNSDIATAFATGKISPAKSYSPWVVGNIYQYSVGSTVDPEIIEYDYEADEFKPTTLVGQLVWLVAQNFTLETSTNDITGAQAEFKLGSALNSGPLNLRMLESGEAYTSGIWVYTPQIGSGPDADIDPYYHYVDLTVGAVSKYAYVNQPFTYNPASYTTSEYFDLLVSQGIITEVSTFDGSNGLPIYRYKPRFQCGQYLEYREFSGDKPTYCIAAQYFTPNSTSLQELIDQGMVINLAPSSLLETQLSNLLLESIPGRISSLSLIDSGTNLINGTYKNIPLNYFDPLDGNGSGALVDITVVNNQVSFFEIVSTGSQYLVGQFLKVSSSVLGGTGTEFTVQVDGLYPYSPSIRPFVRMFTFFKGDRTFFREGNEVYSFTATSSVTPLFDFPVYYKNKIFVESEVYGPSAFDFENYVPFFDPEYVKFAEDTIIDAEGKNLYRVMKAFTPASVVTNWTQMEVVNTPRNEEYAGNLLRYVTLYKCEEEILSQYGLLTSAIKLGVAQITIIPRSSNRMMNFNQNLTFVWENSNSLTETPELSWFPGTTYPYLPPNYGEGTLKL